MHKVMRNVMIVDDEALVRIGLQSIIEWESRGYRIAGVFRSGEEALASARGQSFDVVLTDIRMPGMDGFELIRQLKQIDPRLKFIILSSYSDFEYTRQAIQLGVMDYISKYEMEPVELLRVLDSLQFPEEDKTAEGAAAPQNSGASRQPADKLSADEKAGVLRATAETADVRTEGELADVCERLSIWGDRMRWICLKAAPRESGYSPAERKALALQAEEIFSRLKHLEFFGEDGGLLHGVCVFEPGASAADGLEGLRRVAEELTAAWAHNLNVGLVAGISSLSPLEQMETCRREAEEATQHAFYSGAGIYIRDEAALAVFTEQVWLDWYKHVKNRIQLLQFCELTDDIAAELEADGQRLKPAEWLRLGDTVAALLTDLLIERFDLDMEGVRTFYGSLWPLSDAMKKVRDRGQFLAVIRRLLTCTQETIAALHPSRGWVLRIKEYVENHYGEPIRLEEMADKVNFSPNHFSQRFRQETGEPFSDYLTRVRIREAVRLYRESDYSTEEIAVRVGYTNPNYFVKVFKKATGQTVKQFRRQI